MHNKEKGKSAQFEGSLSGCPFCIASGIEIPEVGTSFRIINQELTPCIIDKTFAQSMYSAKA